MNRILLETWHHSTGDHVVQRIRLGKLEGTGHHVGKIIPGQRRTPCKGEDISWRPGGKNEKGRAWR
jgi:hypothetical protein